MKLTISSVDYAPKELENQLPLIIDLIKSFSEKNITYWVGKLKKPINWSESGSDQEITSLVIMARWVGNQIKSPLINMPINIYYVIDESFIDGPQIDMEKCKYIAIGVATQIDE
jgi:hypothetical protein